MFKQYIKIGIRSISKNKAFSLINVVGLSLGLASMMALAVMVWQYHTTDRFHSQLDRMYYLKTYTPEGRSFTLTAFPLLYEIQKSCPEVLAATHFQGWSDPWLKKGELEVQARTAFVDSGFFKVFSFPLIEGDASRALSDKYSVVISQKVARQLFGTESALGKIIMASDTIGLTVTGVLTEIPSNSSISAEVFLPVPLLMDDPNFSENANWYNSFAENYLLLREGADAKLLDSKIDALVKQFYAKENRNSQVKTVAFTELKKENGTTIGTIVTGAVASAVFIVLVMLANLLNFNTALAFSRTKEVAIRRMVGSGRGRIVLQFCMENALIIGASLLLGFALFILLLLPQLNGVVGNDLGVIDFAWQKEWALLLLFVLVALLMVVVAGSVPAWYTTSVKVTEAVKGRMMKADGRGWLRSVFITIQFALAVVLIGVALILNSQIRFMKAATLGYDPREVAVVNLDMAFKDREQAASRFETIVAELRGNPAVKAVSTTRVIPTSYWENFNNFVDLESGQELRMRQVAVDAGYLDAYQIRMLDGRNFDDQLAASEGKAVIINKTAAKAFGWSDPIGKQIKGKGGDEAVTVVGVMDDFHYSDLQRPIEPLVHRYNGKASVRNNFLSLRLDPARSREVLAKLEQDMSTIPSRRAFSYTFMQERVAQQYALMDGILKMSNYVALLTIFIATIGLFGLVALFARQRVKEIGIRKVLGASVLDITTLLSKDFVKLVLAAILVATPIAWYLMHQWLQDFAYRISLSWWFFAAAGLLALSIALVTVSVQAVKAALAKPVKNIRTE